MSQTRVARSKPAASEVKCKPVAYTAEPWRIIDQKPDESWVVAGESLDSGAHHIATIPGVANDEEQQANARLIAMAPSMHRLAVRLLCAWGTEDAPEAMSELASILGQAVKR